MGYMFFFFTVKEPAQAKRKYSKKSPLIAAPIKDKSNEWPMKISVSGGEVS